MNNPLRKARYTQGFTLVQVSIIITVAALVLVTFLPGLHTRLTSDSISTTRMNAVMVALRQYEAANGILPCPADASLAMGSANYGKAAAFNSANTNHCLGGTPSANYADTVGYYTVGMIPVRTLGLSNDYALDGYGRYFSYALDASTAFSTGGVYTWSSQSAGYVLVDDNGVNNPTAVALISHGVDGHGAWLPLNASSGTGKRLNVGSSDTDENTINAHASGSSFPSNYSTVNPRLTDAEGNSTTYVRKVPTTTFDDLVVYSNSLWNVSTQPVSFQNITVVSPPSNGVYVPGQTLSFIATFPYAVTVTGTPFIGFTVNGVSRTASYASGSGTKNLTFSYKLTVSDMELETSTLGIIVSSPIVSTTGSLTSANSNTVPYYFKLPNSGSGVLNGIGSIATAAASGVVVTAPPWAVLDNSSNCSSAPCIDVTDPQNNRVTQWTTGFAYSQTLASAGSGNAQVTNPSGIAVDSSSNIWVVDTGTTTTSDNRVEEYAVLSGEVITFGGTPGTGNIGDVLSVTITSSALAGSPITVTYSPTTNGMSALLLEIRLAAAVNANATLTAANFSAVRSTGGITIHYPAAFTPAPTFSANANDAGGGTETLAAAAGTSTYGYLTSFGSYGTSTGQFIYPTGITVDKTTNCGGKPCLWIVDTGNNRIQQCSTVSLGACTAYSGGVAFNTPTGITTDSAGNVYVFDTGNSRMDKYLAAFGYTTITSSTTSVGHAGGQFEGATGIAVDSSNDIWVADGQNNRVQELNGSMIWMLTLGGGGVCATGGTCTLNTTSPATTTVSPSTAAGTVYCDSTYGCAPGNGTLYFNNPTGLSFDSSNNLYIVDTNNSRVVKCLAVASPPYSSCSTFGSYGTGTSQFNF